MTHNVPNGRMNFWAGFYERLFNFKEIHFFDIEGRSPASLQGDDLALRQDPHPRLNESQDDKSQIEEFLRE